MARITRKDLKTDKFALEVEHTVDYFEEHRAEIIRYGVAALAIVAVVLAVYYYRQRQHSAAEAALAQAIRIQEAPIAAPAPPPQISFPTQEAKDKEALKAFSDVTSKYSGSDEAIIAEYYLGSIASDKGNTAEAEKRFKLVAEKGDRKYASMAQLALAQMYFGDGRAAQGEQLLQALIAKPTEFVSSEQATIVLARGLAHTNPARARKLLEPLRTSRSSVSQLAIQLYSELPPQ